MRIEEDSVTYDVHSEPMVIHKATMDKLLTLEKPAEAIALYSFYYYTAKWQKTNQIKATESYCKKGLNLGVLAFRRAKKGLVDLGLINDLQLVKDGKITGHYIKVNFVQYQTADISRVEGLNQTADFALVEKQPTNALINNSINALNTNKAKAKASAISKPQDVSDQVWQDFNHQRKSKLTQTALNGITKQAALAGLTLNQALTESVERGWQSFKAEWVKPKQQNFNQPAQTYEQRLNDVDW